MVSDVPAVITTLEKVYAIPYAYLTTGLVLVMLSNSGQIAWIVVDFEWWLWRTTEWLNC